MANLGNIFLQSLNQVLQQANYNSSVAISQNTSLLMGNNPYSRLSKPKYYNNPLVCDYKDSLCEIDDENDILPDKEYSKVEI